MPTRLLLEGRDLEELLAQVRDEHGPDAKIVSAEKVRSGGLGGLFGSQHFELTVEVDDDGAVGGSATGGSATSLEELVSGADAADLKAPSFQDLLASDVKARADRSPTMADALQKLLNEGPSTQDSPAPTVRPFRPGAGQPVAKLGIRPLDTATAAATAAAHHDVPPVDTQEAAVAVEVPEAIATVDRPRTGDASDRLAAAYGAGNGLGAATQTPPMSAQSAAQSATQPAAQPAAQPLAPDRPSGLPRRLQSLGVPADLAFRATGSDTYGAVVEAFAALPAAEPPPDGPGETLIVIGESNHAMEVARAVADGLRIDGEDILFAGRNAAGTGVQSRRRVTGAHDGRAWAKRLRKSDAPSVVAIEAALDESTWAASIVDAIRPAAVWVVVDASRKTSDVAHHIQGLRRVDAIAVRATLCSGDPASPLSLRIPVALLDGRPPTPHAWAAMLCERLSLIGG